MLVPFLAVLVTWLSEFVPVWSTGALSQYNFAVSQYGLPLFWKTRIEHGPIIELESIAFTETSYSWGAFAANALLYAGVGYLLLLWNRRGSLLFRATLMIVSSAWVAIGTALYAWSSQPEQLSNGLPAPWMGVSYGGVWYYNLTLLLVDVAFVAALEYLALFLYRGIRWPKPSTGLMSIVNDPETSGTLEISYCPF